MALYQCQHRARHATRDCTCPHQVLSHLNKDATVLFQHCECPQGAPLVAVFEHLVSLLVVLDLGSRVQRCAIAGPQKTPTPPPHLRQPSDSRTRRHFIAVLSHSLVNADSQRSHHTPAPLGRLVALDHVILEVQHRCASDGSGASTRTQQHDASSGPSAAAVAAAGALSPASAATVTFAGRVFSKRGG